METTNNNLSLSEQKSGAWNTLKSEAQTDRSNLENEALKEYYEICRRHPLQKGHRRGIRPELENLARKYPGISFPGSQKIKTETTEYEIQLRRHGEKLRTIVKEKLHKDLHTISLAKSASRVLYLLNQTNLITGKELLRLSGLGHSSLGRIVGILVSLGFMRNYSRGKYHRYGILEDGRKFMEKIESD